MGPTALFPRQGTTGKDTYIPKYVYQLCQDLSFECFAIFKDEYHFTNRLATSVIIENLKIVIQLPAALDAVSPSLPLLHGICTWLPLPSRFSSSIRNWFVACWLIYFKMVLRFGLKPEVN